MLNTWNISLGTSLNQKLKLLAKLPGKLTKMSLNKNNCYNTPSENEGFLHEHKG